jgi:hypothetical protein
MAGFPHIPLAVGFGRSGPSQTCSRTNGRAESTDVLAANMVISVEPWIYLKGEGEAGFRDSDTVMVTRDGFERLTRCDSDIDRLTIRGLRLKARIRGALIRRALRLKQKARIALEKRRRTT